MLNTQTQKNTLCFKDIHVSRQMLHVRMDTYEWKNEGMEMK